MYSARSPAVSCERPVAVRAGALHWFCLSGSHSWLLGSSAPDWTCLRQDSRAKLIKTNPLREVFHLCWLDRELYIKVFRPLHFSHRLKWLLTSSPAGREFLHLQIARQRGIPTAAPLAWAYGQVNYKPIAILITQSLGQTISLEDVIWQEPLPKGKPLNESLTAAARLIARMHCAGLEHYDLHCGNILLLRDSPEQDLHAAITDLQAVTIYQRGGHTSANPYRRWRIANLAMLFAALRYRIDKPEQYLFVKEYLTAIQSYSHLSTAQIDNYMQKLSNWADRRDFQQRASRDRRALQNSRYAQRIKLTQGWSARVFLQCKHPDPFSSASYGCFQPVDWQKALANPLQLLQDGEILKRGGHNTVVANSLDISRMKLDVVVKHHRLRAGWRGWIKSLMPSRATRQWQRAHALIVRGLATAWPLAAIDHRRLLFLRESIFLCQRVWPGVSLSQWLRQNQNLSPTRRKELARRLAELLAKLRRSGIRHRDCKATNIMVAEAAGKGPDHLSLLLVDLDGVHLRRFWWLSCWTAKYLRHEAIVRLAASVNDLPLVQPSDFVRVFHLYIKTLDLPEVHNRRSRRLLWQTMVRQVQKKIRHDNHAENSRKNLSQREFHNILIVKPSSLGDIVRSLPVFYGLRRRFPNARISWLIRPDCADILRNIPTLDEIIEFDRRWFAKIGQNYRASRDFLNFILQLRHRRFDLVIDLQGLFRSGFISFCCGAAVRVGFAHARELAGCFYTHRINTPNPQEHIVDSYWRFAVPLGFSLLDKKFDLPVDPAAALTGGKLLQKLKISPKAGYLVMLIGGTEPAKHWPAEKFADLARRLNKCYDTTILLLGAGPAEAILADRVVKIAGVVVCNLVNQTTLQELIWIISRARLVIGNDSGPLHIAAALSVPLIGLYGPTNPKVVGPYGQMAAVAEAGADTTRLKRYSRLPVHHMHNITIEQVLPLIQEKLSISDKCRNH